MKSMTGRHLARLTRMALLGAIIASSWSLAGCDDDDDITSPQSLEGTYVLTSVNGGSLPFTLPGTAPNVIVVESAELNIAANGTYDGSVLGEENGAAQELFADAGTATQTGTTVTFTSSSFQNLTYSGTRNGDVISFAIPGQALGASGVLTLTFER